MAHTSAMVDTLSGPKYLVHIIWSTLSGPQYLVHMARPETGRGGKGRYGRGDAVDDIYYDNFQPMDTLWTPYGHPMDTLWTSYGHPMDILWTPYGVKSEVSFIMDKKITKYGGTMAWPETGRGGKGRPFR